MMRAYGALAVVALFLVSCHADPHQNLEGRISGNDHFDSTGHKSRTPDSISNGNLVRAVRESHYFGLPNLGSRYDYYRPNPFVRRNFDEIDQTSMPFPYKKRVSRFYQPNFIDSPAFYESKEEKRFHDIPMDEIDLSYFPIGSRR